MADTERVRAPDGTELAVHDLGGSGGVLLVAHATGFCGRMYQPLADLLADRHRVLAVDLRGHGDSSAPANLDFEWHTLGGDVIAVIDAFGCGPVHAFGHSMGGAAVLLGESASPGHLRSAFLYEPIVFPTGFRYESGESPLAEPARRRRATFASRAEALWRFAHRPPLDQMRGDALALYVDHGMEEQPDGSVRLKCEPDSESRVYASEEASQIGVVAGCDLPVTIAVGTAGADRETVGYAEALAAALPDAVLQHYDHLGHFGPFQDPVSVAAAVRAHVSRAEQTEAAEA
jgi:pimeloyl-ACP methyl ester carboxylesterase